MLERLEQIPADFWSVLAEMSPYLLLGFLVAGGLSVLIPTSFVEKHLGKGIFWPVVKAAAVGVPLPLCSCGVIPVSASLRRHGAGRGATTAFLISTPQTGVDSIFVTYSLLGGVFAIFRPITALICGVLGGGLVSVFEKNSSHADYHKPETCMDACCIESGRGKFYRAMSYGFGTLPRDIGKHMLVGIFIAALISAFIPENFFTPYLGGGILAMLVMMVLGIPVYVCATASVPLAWALIDKGISPGAALVFLMTGPATNAATIAVVWKTMGHKTAIIYLISVAASALGAGLLLDYFFEATNLAPEPGMAYMLPDIFKWICAIVLLGVLGIALFRGVPKETEAVSKLSAGMKKITLNISGMTCRHCTQNVRTALLEAEGVESAHVDLASKQAVVVGNEFDIDSLRQSVEKLGYSIENITEETHREKNK